MAEITLRKNKSGALTFNELDGNFEALNSNFYLSDIDPTTTDDESKHFSVGSIWTNTAKSKKYECKDATADNAVWEEAYFGGAIKEIKENDVIGYGLKYREEHPDNYGDIGQRATDLSINDSDSDTAGATGIHSFAAGYQTTASGNYSVAAGTETTASGGCSVTTGDRTTASGNYSVATGYKTTASGDYSFANGGETTASGDYSIATGYKTTASGNYSVAAGQEATASGKWSFATGYKTTASGVLGFTAGQEATAQGSLSIATGFKTIAINDGEFAYGLSFADSGAFSTAFALSNSTTDATQTKLNASNPITTDGKVTLEYFKYRLFASRNDKSEQWIREGTFIADRTADTCTISDETSSDIKKDVSSWALDFVVDNENFDIKVTGEDDKNIVWQMNLEKNIIYF